MSVLLTVSETYGGPQVADALASPAPGPVGLDLGAVVNGSYAPVISRADNTGHAKVYIRHNGVIDPITAVKFFIAPYGTGTGYPYGGPRTAAADYSNTIGLGAASGSSKNNADGLSGGLWLDASAAATVPQQFDKANYPSKVAIFGQSGAGVSLPTAFNLLPDSLVVGTNQGAGIDGDGQYLPTAPLQNVIGQETNGILGDSAKLRLRIYLPLAYTNGGYHQLELVISYSYTA